MNIRVVANSRNAYRPLAAILAASVVLLVVLQVDFSPHNEWRRTAHGWERSGVWLVAASSQPGSLHESSIRSPAIARFDTHPVALAFAQLVGTLLAFFAAAPQTDRRQHGRLLSAISRSFRASVFGS